MTDEPQNPGMAPVFIPDESLTIEKVRKKYQTGLESVRAQLKRHDVMQQEQKAKLMQALSRPENSGLELTDVTYKYIDVSEAYELTLLLIKEYLEGYLENLEETSELSSFREAAQRSANKMLKELDRLRRENTALYNQYRIQQEELTKFANTSPEPLPEEEGEPVEVFQETPTESDNPP